jgi:acyl-CoA synthetase (NDP forming)
LLFKRESGFLECRLDCDKTKAILMGERSQANKYTEFKKLLHPESLALIGVPRGSKQGSIFLRAMLDCGFPGKLFLINPWAEKINGLKAYSSVKAVENRIDMAILLVPNSKTPQVLQECAEKGVKIAILYTAGYSELGTEEGQALEKRILDIAGSRGMRLIGPNCMGIYSPKAHLSNFPELSKTPGKMGLISQSGSLTNILCKLMPSREIFFSMAISTGNEVDLNSTDFLWYFGRDNNTKFIALYLEGIKDGRRFFNVLKETTLKKPVIIWKTGATAMGKQAISSHTGGMAGAIEMWKAVFRQCGVTAVVGIEEFIDVITAFYVLPEGLDSRIGIVSGPGGLAVSAADACQRVGLQLANLKQETQMVLRFLIPATGTSVRNPVDLGLSASLDINLLGKAAETVGRDPGVDAVMIIGAGINPEQNRAFPEVLPKARKVVGKPFIMVSLPGFGVEQIGQLFQHGIPVFDSVERAANAYAKVLRYQNWLKSQKGIGGTIGCKVENL